VIVCHCRVVSDRQITAAVQAGARDVEDVTAACQAGAECFGCHDRICEIVETLADLPALRRAS
jgi:bacterioferritin-associated ferredoxin